MSRLEAQRPNLDPWSASSLLQKAIRRGEVELAQRALLALHGHRGKSVWRRLASIALEDVGIANPALVWESVRLATDGEAKASRSNADLLKLTKKLALSPKDRSADYAFCSATKLAQAIEDRKRFDAVSIDENLRIATSDLEPVTRRAVAALSACCVLRGKNTIVDVTRTNQFAEAFCEVPEPLRRSMLALTGASSHLFGPVLMVLWSQYSFVGGGLQRSYPILPQTEWVDGVPLYTFDKHTAVGKRAIAQFVRESSSVQRVLARNVAQQHWTAVAEMAAFYADAAPIACRLEWAFSKLLWYTGLVADMTSTRCPIDAAAPLLKCVEDNLSHLNHLRRVAIAHRRR